MANSRADYDVGLMLYSIAKLGSWSSNGVSYSTMWGKGKTPGGIKEIREAASTNIAKMHEIVDAHSKNKHLRAEKTEAFYELIKNVHDYSGDNPSDHQREMIEAFCLKYLDQADRNSLPGAQKTSSNAVKSAVNDLFNLKLN